MPTSSTMAGAMASARLTAALLLGWAVALSGCTSAGGTDGKPPATAVAITNVAVVDVERGQLIPDQTVVVRGGRIAAVGPATAQAA